MNKPKTHPGAVELHGALYLHDSKGDLKALDNISAEDLLIDETVRKLCGYAEDLSAELARFQSHTYADIASLDAMLDQEYGVSRPSATKGNRTFPSFAGDLQVKVCMADQISFGPSLQSAKKLLDELILDKAKGADSLLVSLVTQAFQTDKEGKINIGSILNLRRMKVDDPRWADITRAIDDSIKPEGSKSYLRFYRRSEADGKMTMIPLDLAAITPSAKAFERNSLRRQVEELTDTIDKTAKLLNVARSYGEDGAMASLLATMDMARELVGDKVHETDLTVPGIDGATAPGYVRLWLASLPLELLTDTLGQDLAAAIQKELGALSQAAE